MKTLILSLVGGLALSGPALAGGWGGGVAGAGQYASCADLAAAGAVAAGTTCVDASGTLVTVSSGTHRRFFCPYPHRPSDSVFVNGSGYIIKDTLRRQQGCL
ncbi:hypothetical protein [Palleronia pelagia]|uniref:Uncharacterized protein n=1 Tax=Palleronia pelagia TaxID=387096 RepID=A0A1H8AUF5_9RHOB|nr:hypothetical protein [Palleronia pelagia]SEM74173.1 hypothetical protein SAMN04488011_101308 [Palleronia pelagia]